MIDAPARTHCPRCQGALVAQWDVDDRRYYGHCIPCGFTDFPPPPALTPPNLIGRRSQSVELRCEVCGTPYLRSPGKARGSRYCDYECARKGLLESRRQHAKAIAASRKVTP